MSSPEQHGPVRRSPKSPTPDPGRDGVSGGCVEGPVYHGTTRAVLESGLTALHRPFLTPRWDVACYYAEVSASEDGSDPVVLELAEVPKVALRYDSAAMDEPVLVAESEVSAACEEIAAAHPDWVHTSRAGTEMLLVPASQWELSWAVVGSARAEGSLGWVRVHPV